MAGVTTADLTIPGGGIEGSSLTGSYQQIAPNAGKSIQAIVIISTVNEEAVLSFDGGVTDWIILPGEPVMIPLTLPHMHFSGEVHAKHNGNAPTTGRISIGFVAAV